MGFTFCNEFGNYLETPPIEIALERALNNLEFSSRNQRKYEVEEIPIDSKDEDDDTSESNS